jgi:hypothetical protein
MDNLFNNCLIPDNCGLHRLDSDTHRYSLFIIYHNFGEMATIDYYSPCFKALFLKKLTFREKKRGVFHINIVWGMGSGEWGATGVVCNEELEIRSRGILL